MGYIASEETRRKQSETKKKLWAAGIYDGKWSKAAKEKMSIKMKQKAADGLIKVPSQRYAETQDPKLKHTAKGPDHYHSKYWKFRSPMGVLLEGKNLSDLVRNNPELFDPKDLVWRGKTQNQCNAVNCLCQLQMKKPDGSYRRSSWKGWTLIEVREVWDE